MGPAAEAGNLSSPWYDFFSSSRPSYQGERHECLDQAVGCRVGGDDRRPVQRGPGTTTPLITNRSFESGTDPGGATVLAPGSKAIDGWTVVDADVSYVGQKWQHAEGARSVALLCGGGITQTIETEPDQTYEVRFNMAGDPDAAPSLKTVIVSLGAETRVFTFDTAGRKGTDMGWASRTHVFKASAKTSTLAFRSPKDKCSVAGGGQRPRRPDRHLRGDPAAWWRLRQRALSARYGWGLEAGTWTDDHRYLSVPSP